MQKRIVFGAVALGVILATNGQAGQDSADEILKKVAMTYQNLKIYQFAAQYQILLMETYEITRDQGADNRRIPGSTSLGMGGPANFYVEVAAGDSGKVRVCLKTWPERATVILVVSDGRTTWASKPREKEYTEKSTPLTGMSDADIRAVAEELNFVRKYFSLLVGRFRGIAKFGPEASLQKDARLKIGGEKVDCYVIKWQTDQANDEIWVDKDRFAVWRLKQTPTAGAPAGTMRQAQVTLDFTQADLNPHLEDSLFTFAPADNLTKVTLLKWPSGS